MAEFNDREGLELDVPGSASEVASSRGSSYEGESAFRSINLESLGTALSATDISGSAGFADAASSFQTSFRSVCVHQGVEKVGPLLVSQPEVYRPLSATKAKEIQVAATAAPNHSALHHAVTTTTTTTTTAAAAPTVQVPSRPITPKPLPKSPVFALEPVSHFRIAEDAPQLPSYVDSVLRETLACGVELDSSSAKWRCVHASAFSYITFVVTVYSDGFDHDGKAVYVVEAQRRSGNVQDFMSFYRALKNSVRGQGQGAAQGTPVLSSPMLGQSLARKRCMPPPPPALLESLGMGLQQMHVASFNELLRLEGAASFLDAHREAVRALAELTQEDGACAALAEEAEDEDEQRRAGGSVAQQVCRRLVKLLKDGDVVTSSYAANALASLSNEPGIRSVIAEAGGVSALATAAADAESVEEVGLRRGSGEALRNLAKSPDARLSDEDITAVHRFLVTANSSGDGVLTGFATEARAALGLQA